MCKTTGIGNVPGAQGNPTMKQFLLQSQAQSQAQCLQFCICDTSIVCAPYMGGLIEVHAMLVVLGQI